jgi:hypothetical protein
VCKPALRRPWDRASDLALSSLISAILIIVSSTDQHSGYVAPATAPTPMIESGRFVQYRIGIGFTRDPRNLG